MDPCPISVAAERMVMLPSGAMLTQGDSVLPVRSLATIAARATTPLSAKENESPAAPIMT